MTIYIQTFIFGITLAISIGPIAILILNQSINCGVKNGLFCGLGAATADLTYAIIAFSAGSFLIPLVENNRNDIPLISSVILILFSFWMIYSTLKKPSAGEEKDFSLVCKFPALVTYGLTISNPLTIVVFVGFAGLLTSEGEGSVFLHAAVIFIASLSVQMIIAIVGSRLAYFFSRPKTLLYFNIASSLGIMGLGFIKLLQG